ncbi:MAG: hypothetical protein WHT06_10495 [Desulfobacterales bacterium]
MGNQMRGGHRARGAGTAAVILAVFLIASACSTLRDAARSTGRVLGDAGRSVGETFSPGTRPGGLRLPVAVFAGDGLSTPAAADAAARLQRHLEKHLETRCGGILLDAEFPRLLVSPPRLSSGGIDGHALALLARPRGVSDVVVGTPLEPWIEEEKTGFWLWKGIRTRVGMGLRLEIFDVETGGKSLDERFWEETSVDLEPEVPGTAVPFEKIPPAVVETLQGRLFAEAARGACRALAARPWRGFVVAAEGRELTIAAGRGTGLREGQRLEVFAAGRSLVNREGQRFFLPGGRVGEARIRSVGELRSVAVLEETLSAEVGATVRLKP